MTATVTCWRTRTVTALSGRWNTARSICRSRERTVKAIAGSTATIKTRSNSQKSLTRRVSHTFMFWITAAG